MIIFIYIIITAILFAAEIFYLRLAMKRGIYAHTSATSTHNRPTVTGGGIIFFLSFLLYLLLSCFNLLPPPNNNSTYLVAFAGIAILTGISFKDDISQVPICIRLIFHLIAILLIASQASVFNLEWYYIIIFIICGTGFINAYNFMDGIAGITACYSIVVLSSIYYINCELAILSPALIIFILISAIIFFFANFRKRELCFCGDTGSITMGGIIFFMVSTLIVATKNPLLFILVIVYGADTTLTIVRRLLAKENIFKAHNKHIYQIVARKWNLPHRTVAVIYAALQATITIGFIITPLHYSALYVGANTLLLIAVYIIFAKSSKQKKRSFDTFKRT